MSIQIDHLCKRYGDSVVFSQVSLQVQAGEFVAIVGESGAHEDSIAWQCSVGGQVMRAEMSQIDAATLQGFERFGKPETTPDISVYWISTYYADPHNWIGEMFHSSNAGTFKNAHHYKNPKVDELLDKAVQSTDQPTRAKYYEEAVRIVVADAPGLWIYNTKWYGPYSKKLQGIVFCPIGNAQEMRTAYYE